jgi:hypothetical protein
VNRRRFLTGLAATLVGAAGLAGATRRPKATPSPPPPTTVAALPATTTTATTTTATTTTTLATETSAPPPAAPVRPRPGAEPFPDVDYPPATTVTLRGVQTTQYGPNGVSDRIFDLTGAVWRTSPAP